MALLTDFSLLTVGLSAGVSVVTGYVGTLLQFRRQRDRARRMYGLAILAEIKTLQRVFRQYQGVLGTDSPEVRISHLPKLRLCPADLNVFGTNSGNIGLFSVRTAVEVIELYSRMRALIAQAAVLTEGLKPEATPDDDLKTELFDHLRAVVVVRQHSRQVADMLRRELPVLPEERLRFFRRRASIGLRRLPRTISGFERRVVGPTHANPSTANESRP